MRMTDQQREESIEQQAYEKGFNDGVKFGVEGTLKELQVRIKDAKESSYKGK